MNDMISPENTGFKCYANFVACPKFEICRQATMEERFS